MDTFIHSKDFIKFCHKVFDNLPIAIDFLDKDGQIMYINKAFKDFLNISDQEVTGMVVTDVETTSRFLEVLKSKQAEIAWRHKFLNGRDAIVHRIPIIDDGGELLGGFGAVLFQDYNELDAVMEKYRILDRQLKLYKNEIARINTAKNTLNDIIGNTPEIEKCKDMAKKVAKFNSNVLILGESGVGKEIFANAVHTSSQKRDMPFICLNCSAIPENLLESELFGYEEGSFTGAKKGGNMGKFELANGGTIFLDEIGEMPYHMQAKILRVLQEKEIERIGGKSRIKLDVRVICATNRNLEDMVKKGKFREDLYYRLNVLTIEIPPLRKRKDDIPLFVDKFMSEFYRESGLFRNTPDNVMEILKKYNWPGNIRELRNVVEKICVNSEDATISINDLPPYIINSSIKDKLSDRQAGLGKIIESVEKEVILNTLKECRNNKSETAKKLNIPRATLYRKIEEYGLEMDI
ncbi:MAG: PspF2 [Clostridia bacterium]|jgi:transcriptional regulator with PAS, ATPase and Fis domain|nr:PspF2 [Clostridia bacterium]